MSFRQSLTMLDRILIETERALATALGAIPESTRSSPAAAFPDCDLAEDERRHAAGLMRVNHTGEVCAQALYSGQAAVSRATPIREHLLAAAAEETDHLAWCADRLAELKSHPSVLNPLWYGGSFAFGVLAGCAGDKLSLGFVAETERQVEAHLAEHLQSLPSNDLRSRVIVQRMQIEEARHAETALATGGSALPNPVPTLMRWASRVMKWAAYRW